MLSAAMSIYTRALAIDPGGGCAVWRDGRPARPQPGLIASRFAPCASDEEALDRARGGSGIAWIGSVGASPDELERIARAFGLGERALAQLALRRRSRRVTRLERAAHLTPVGVRHVTTVVCALTWWRPARRALDRNRRARRKRT